jgi:hypothetical protein
MEEEMNIRGLTQRTILCKECGRRIEGYYTPRKTACFECKKAKKRKGYYRWKDEKSKQKLLEK